MFKAAQIYRLTYPVNREVLEAGLAALAHAEIGNSEAMRQGFTKPRGDTHVHSVQGRLLIELTTDRRLLPASVVNQVAKARAAELEEQQGFAPGKKAMKEIKERVYDELLPRSHVKRDVTRAIITSEWLIIDAATASKADDVIKLLLKAVDRFPVEAWRVQRSPVAVMTGWLQDDEAPAGFTVDRDAILRATGESKAQVAYKSHTLEPSDIRHHIAAGKQCTKLAMTWDSKISFVLDQTLAVKGIKLLDVLKENQGFTANDAERFDGELLMFAGEFTKLLHDLTGALGGMASDGAAPSKPEAASLLGLMREHGATIEKVTAGGEQKFERAVGLTADLYKVRAMHRDVLNELYFQTIQPVIERVRERMAETSDGALKSAIDLAKELPPGSQSGQLFLVAAVEIMQPTPAKVEAAA